MCSSHKTQNCVSKTYFMGSAVPLGEPQPGPSSFCFLLISTIKILQISAWKQLKAFEHGQQCFALPSEMSQWELLCGKQRVRAGLALGRFGSQWTVEMWHQSSAVIDFSRGFCSVLGCSTAPEHCLGWSQLSVTQTCSKSMFEGLLPFPSAQSLLAPSTLCINHCHQVTHFDTKGDLMWMCKLKYLRY